MYTQLYKTTDKRGPVCLGKVLIKQIIFAEIIIKAYKSIKDPPNSLLL